MEGIVKIRSNFAPVSLRHKITTMKKIIFLAALLLTTSSSLLAEEQSLLLNVRYADPIDLIGKGPGTDHRSPARKPTIFVSDSTFILNGAFEGCCLYLVSENDEVVFSYNIEVGCDEIVIPSYITGTLELQIVSGNICYYCDIELD